MQVRCLISRHFGVDKNASENDTPESVMLCMLQLDPNKQFLQDISVLIDRYVLAFNIRHSTPTHPGAITSKRIALFVDLS